VNAAGGINGHKVNVISKDAGVAPGANLTGAKELITQDHVAAIIDMDATDAAWLPYASAQKVPVILGYPSVTGVVDADAFPIMGSPYAIGYALLSTGKSFGTKMGLVYCAEGCSSVATLYQAFSKPAGVSFPVLEQASSTAPDYTAVCQSLKDESVGSYILQFGGAAATEITNTCYQQGLHTPQVLEGPNAVVSWKTDTAFDNDPVVDGVTPYFESATPAQQAYRAALAKYASSIPGSTLDDSWSAFAWLGGELFQAAAKNATGSITAASVTAAMYTLKNETLGGMVQPLNYVKGKPTSLNCYYTWKISNGSFVTDANSNTPTCVPAATLAPFVAAAAAAASK
jgi:branched-chain amino acid transport system substrate-binding protein